MKQHIFITGASRGIGRATAKLLATQGHHLACAYHQSHREALSLQEEIVALGGTCLLVQGDLGKGTDCERLVGEVLRGFPKLDGIVLNAGVSALGLLQDMTAEQWAELMEVNLHSVHRILRLALPRMIDQRCGSIVTVSSMWGQVGASYEVAYSASKAGLLGLTKALAQELAPSGIRVNAVSPGLIQTEMNSMLEEEEYQCFIEKIPLGRAGTVEEVAEAISFLLSNKSSYITGHTLAVNGGQVV